MSELIADLDVHVVADTGAEYYVSVAAELEPTGRWEAWLEFVPLDDSDVLVTPTETHQSTRADVEHWTTMLTQAYVEGAFERAVPVGAATASVRHVAMLHAAITDVTEPPAGIDPFALMSQGKSVLRTMLRPLTRTQLLTLISRHGLNPAGKSLAWLTHSQLVTFIATATEVQLLQRSR